MTSTFYLLLVLSLHGPAAPADRGICEAQHAAHAANDGSSQRRVSAKEVEDSKDERVALDDRGGVSTSIADAHADPWMHALPPPVRGDAVATHSARGPPAA